MEPEKQAPPECCPVCGDLYTEMRGTKNAVRIATYPCGAEWWADWVSATGTPNWHTFCSHAMTACLRTGATLRPTAKETATAALVEAADKYVAAWRAWQEAPFDYNTSEDLRMAHKGLLAATQEPRR